jgi:hypothetical protein
MVRGQEEYLSLSSTTTKLRATVWYYWTLSGIACATIKDDRPDFPTLLRSIRSAKEAGKHHGLENALFESDKWMADSLMMELEDMVRFAATGDNSIHTDIQADFPGRKSVHQ